MNVTLYHPLIIHISFVIRNTRHLERMIIDMMEDVWMTARSGWMIIDRIGHQAKDRDLG